MSGGAAASLLAYTSHLHSSASCRIARRLRLGMMRSNCRSRSSSAAVSCRSCSSNVQLSRESAGAREDASSKPDSRVRRCDLTLALGVRKLTFTESMSCSGENRIDAERLVGDPCGMCAWSLNCGDDVGVMGRGGRGESQVRSSPSALPASCAAGVGEATLAIASICADSVSMSCLLCFSMLDFSSRQFARSVCKSAHSHALNGV